jgi:hypothetical protein
VSARLVARCLGGAALLTAMTALAAPAGALPPGPPGQPPRASTATGANVPAPAVSGPVANTTAVGDPGHGYPFLATDVDLAKSGYVEEEYLISGQANRYTITGTNTATVLSSGNPYSTRIVVRRPTNPAKFNGVVLAEWTNVSNNWDQEIDWFQTHEHLIQQGYAWVGVSAQRAGIHSTTGLRAWSPSRYGTLDVTAGNTINDDSLSYDIFSQAVKAIRSPAGTDPLGALPAPQYVIATGQSQSATRLRTYYNSILPLANIVDAVVLHGGGGAMRTDQPQPVFRINSEGDIASGIGNGARQADSPVFRLWEVAGASHGDWKLITDYGPLRKRDIGTYPGGYPGEPQTCTLPSLSHVPQHMVQSALYDDTIQWIAYGVAPPSAPVISTTTPTGTTVVRDSLGLAQGGIRLAAQEAPTRVNSGSNTGPGFCFLDGSSVPLTDAQLATLYPTVQSYVDKVVATTKANAAAGYIPADYTRDPAWYTDIRDIVRQYDARLDDNLGANLTALAARAEDHAGTGEKLLAILDLEQLADAASRGITGDDAARDAVLRPTKAALALLKDALPPLVPAVKESNVAGIVPATLSITLGTPATFGAFIPGVARNYDASTSVTATGRLVNGSRSLPQVLQVSAAGGPFAAVGGAASPTALKAWNAPFANDVVALTFRQAIGATDALATGVYSKTLTLTLAATTP